jgi:hypothetical protein
MSAFVHSVAPQATRALAPKLGLCGRPVVRYSSFNWIRKGAPTRMSADAGDDMKSPPPGKPSVFMIISSWMKRRSEASLRMSAQLRGYGFAAVISYGMPSPLLLKSCFCRATFGKWTNRLKHYGQFVVLYLSTGLMVRTSLPACQP